MLMKKSEHDKIKKAQKRFEKEREMSKQVVGLTEGELDELICELWIKFDRENPDDGYMIWALGSKYAALQAELEAAKKALKAYQREASSIVDEMDKDQRIAELEKENQLLIDEHLDDDESEEKVKSLQQQYSAVAAVAKQWFENSQKFEKERDELRELLEEIYNELDGSSVPEIRWFRDVEKALKRGGE